MPEKGLAASVAGDKHRDPKDAVSIHTRKIYDACREEHGASYKFFAHEIM